MAIIIKYSDTETYETDFNVINTTSMSDELKNDYINKFLVSEDTVVELIYPYHTETYALYAINYRSRRYR